MIASTIKERCHNPQFKPRKGSRLCRKNPTHTTGSRPRPCPSTPGRPQKSILDSIKLSKHTIRDSAQNDRLQWNTNDKEHGTLRTTVPLLKVGRKLAVLAAEIPTVPMDMPQIRHRCQHPARQPARLSRPCRGTYREANASQTLNSGRWGWGYLPSSPVRCSSTSLHFYSSTAAPSPRIERTGFEIEVANTTPCDTIVRSVAVCVII